MRPLWGRRDDLDLDQRWWHRLIKVASILLLVPYGALLVAVNANRHEWPRRAADVSIMTNLAMFMGKQDASISAQQAMDDFVTLPGALGLRRPSGDVDYVSISDVRTLSCSPMTAAQREEAAKGIVEFEKLVKSGQLKAQLNAVSSGPALPSVKLGDVLRSDGTDWKIVEEPIPDRHGAPSYPSFCRIPVELKGTIQATEDVVKFEDAFRYKVRPYLSALAWLLVSAVVALNAYYRGFVYIVCGPRRTA